MSRAVYSKGQRNVQSDDAAAEMKAREREGIWPIVRYETVTFQDGPITIALPKGKWTSHRTVLMLNETADQSPNKILTPCRNMRNLRSVQSLSFESQGCFLTKYKSEGTVEGGWGLGQWRRGDWLNIKIDKSGRR